MKPREESYQEPIQSELYARKRLERSRDPTFKSFPINHHFLEREKD